MTSLQQTKKQLLQELQIKKQKLREIEQKCQLQNKKIKLYRKENEQLQSVIEEMNQSDTNLLLGSKELLNVNTKIQKTIEELRGELERVKMMDRNNNHYKGYNKKGKEYKGSYQQDSNQQGSQLALTNNNNKPLTIPVLSIISIRQSTINKSTLQIDLPNCQLTDQQFLQLESFAQLKQITVNDNLLTNTSINMICSRFIKLEKLNVANNKFDFNGLKEINNLKNLVMLDVRNNNVGDEGIIYISQLDKLTDLSCSKNNITDKALTSLSNLTQLNYLDITNNLITSESIPSFIKLQKLTHLYLMSNRLDKQGIITLLKSSKSLQFLDVRFNVWNNQDKQSIKANKPQNLEVFC